MIKSWKNKASQRVQEGDPPRRMAGLDLELAQRRLAMLDAITSLSDIPRLKSINLHRLSGDRRGLWAVNVNGPWRICFQWRDGHVHQVEITDYHKG